jgi:hypothetical protein
MSCSSLRLPSKLRADRRICLYLYHCAILVAVSMLVFGLNACSGNNTTSSGQPPSTNNPGGSGGSTGSGGSSGSSSSGFSISSSLPSGTVGSPYNATITVTGGGAPYTFTVVSGALPSGLSLKQSSGAISGTPSASGTSNFAVSVADAAGVSQQQSFQIVIGSAPTAAPPSQSSGSSFSSVQNSGGWQSYGQQGPNYVDCSPSPCDGITWWMGQGISSPSISGNAAGFALGGTSPFSDALFTNPLIGTDSTQGMPDSNQTLVPTLNSFTYDVYIFNANFSLAQAVEFDVNQFFGSVGLIFGHQCRIASGNEWDVWDNQNKKWVPTGVPCYLNDNSWNHITIQVQRNSSNELVYQSITLNGQTSTLNWVFPPGSSGGWYGVTINYQMDGNADQASYTTYLDNLTVSYQ